MLQRIDLCKFQPKQAYALASVASSRWNSCVAWVTHNTIIIIQLNNLIHAYMHEPITYVIINIVTCHITPPVIFCVLVKTNLEQSYQI